MLLLGMEGCRIHIFCTLSNCCTSYLEDSYPIYFLILLLGKGMSENRCELVQWILAMKAPVTQSPILRVGQGDLYREP